jgi:hypothetical protein
MLAVCLCTITGCRGGAAQEPYDGVVVSGPATTSVAAPAAPADEPIASEVDIPWTIALLSDAASRPAASPPLIVVESDPASVVIPEGSVDLQLAVDHGGDDKRTVIKVCPGVVKGRS